MPRRLPTLGIHLLKESVGRHSMEAVTSRFSEAEPAVPAALAVGDLNHDGRPDLICGFSDSFGGFVTIHPATSNLRQREAPATNLFDFPGRVVALPVVPDFLETGDFDRDGSVDLLAAASGSGGFWILFGRPDGSLSEPREQKLPGLLTALAAGDFGRIGLGYNVAAAVNGAGRYRLLIFESLGGLFGDEPAELSLPAAATSLALGQLDEDHFADIAAAAGNELLIVYGSDGLRNLTGRDLEVESRVFDREIVSLVAADLTPAEHDEAALLFADGTVSVLSRDESVTWQTRFGPWAERQSGAQGAVRPTARLAAGRISVSSNERLFVADSTAAQIEILPDIRELLDPAASGWMISEAIATSGRIVSVASMHLNRDSLSDLVVLQEGEDPLLFSITAAGTTFTVDSAGDEPDADPNDGDCRTEAGACTLRAAIQQANTSGDLDDIRFAGGLTTIRPEANLPAIESAIVIDGLTGRAGRLEIDGTKTTADNFGGVIDLRGGPSTVRGLIINRSVRSAIALREGGHTIVGNWLGTDRTGTQAAGNRRGVWVVSPDNRIGGAQVEDRNLVADSNGDGIVLNGSVQFLGVPVVVENNRIIGNYIGTDVNGIQPLGNDQGIGIVGNLNTVGGEGAGAGNVVADSTQHGMFISGTGNVIQGNLVGTDFTGRQALGNRLLGLRVPGSQTTIGGDSDGAANTIGANGFEATGLTSDDIAAGIQLRRGAATGNVVEGNYIGTNSFGDDLGNASDGVLFFRSGGHEVRANQIAFNQRSGVRVAGDGNRVEENKIWNNRHGVEIHSAQTWVRKNEIRSNQEAGIVACCAQDTADNVFSQNSIHDNGELGIDLSLGTGFFIVDPIDGLTANDPGDADEGPNGLQNFPVLTEATSGSISGTLQSSANLKVDLEFFSNAAPDPSGNGEGETFLGALTGLTTDGNGNLAFQAPFGAISGCVTATATTVVDGVRRETSEFSNCVAVAEKEPFMVNTEDDDPDDNPGDSFCSTGKKADGSAGACNPQVQDDCECTFRAAVQEANAGPDLDTILFRPAVDGIDLKSTLEPISQPVQIDGGGVVTINDLNRRNENGILRVFGGNSLIKGLILRHSSDDETVAIRLDEKGDNVVEGCNLSPPNGFDPAILIDSSDNRIGRPNNLVESSLEDPESTVVCLDPCNRIFTLEIRGSGNRVEGNLMNGSGVSIRGREGFDDPSGNMVGGAEPGAGNLILTSGVGVWIEPGNDNKVQGNLLVGNRFGALVSGTDNWIGGFQADEGNIFELFDAGVVVKGAGTRGTRILSNTIVNSTGLGIDLTPSLDSSFQPDGLTKNDRNDGDAGPNGLQNFPVLTGATTDGETVLVRGKLDSTPDSPYDIQLFSNAACNPNRGGTPDTSVPYGEGESLLATFSIGTNLVGNGFFARRFPVGQLAGPWITATATDLDGNTSEFSKCIEVEQDSDGDGITDADEDAASGGDANNDGTPDSQQANVVTFSSDKFKVTCGDQALCKDPQSSITFETNVEALIVLSILEPFEMPLPGTFQQEGNVWNSAIRVRLSKGQNGQTAEPATFQAGDITVTWHLPPGYAVSSFFNFGPTPGNPVDHVYEFLFDGTTGAEIFADRIVVHYVDGRRGDHDLQVNGVIDTLGGPVQAGDLFYFPQVGNGAIPDFNLQFQTRLIFNDTRGAVNPVQLDFNNSQADPLEVDLDALGSDARFSFGLLPGGSLSTTTSGQGDLQVGYVSSRGGEGLGGTGVFSRRDLDSGVLLFEAGVPAARPLRDFTVFVDSLGNRDTGLAIVYPAIEGPQESVNLLLRLYDRAFTLVAIRELQLAPGEHRARFVAELFPDAAVQASEMEGSVTVSADQDIVAVTLRQNDDPNLSFPQDVPTLTSFPVIPGRAEEAVAAQNERRAVYVPQFADGVFAPPEFPDVPGLQFQSSVILVNTGPDTTVQLAFFASGAIPQEQTLSGLGTGSVFEVPLPRGASFSTQTPGTGDLQVGYLRIAATEQVGVTVVFARSDLASGTVLFEAGVPAARELTDFTIPVDTTGTGNTGIAIVRPTADSRPLQVAGEAVMTARLYDRDFVPLAERELSLLELQHTARFVTEIFDGVAGVDEMQGVLTIESNLPVAAVALRENVRPQPFPQSVPTLTAFPVIAGRADKNQ